MNWKIRSQYSAWNMDLTEGDDRVHKKQNWIRWRGIGVLLISIVCCADA